MLFQGQEVLEDGFFEDDDPIDWTKATTYAGIRLMYKDMIRLRRNCKNLVALNRRTVIISSGSRSQG